MRQINFRIVFISMKNIILFTILFCQSVAFAGLLYPYNRLATKDLDQMNKIIKDKIKESKSSAGNATIPLKEALQAIFTRPNQDGMIEKLLPSIKTELDEHDAYEKTFQTLVKEAAGALNNSKAFKKEALLSYLLFLENTVSEMKPKVAEPFENSILTQIRDAKIEYNSDLLKERKLRMLSELPSVSELADQVLKEHSDKTKEQATQKVSPVTEESKK